MVSLQPSHSHHFWSQQNSNTVPLEEKLHGSVTVWTYYRFFTAGGGYIGSLLTVVLFILVEVSVQYYIYQNVLIVNMYVCIIQSSLPTNFDLRVCVLFTCLCVENCTSRHGNEC